MAGTIVGRTHGAISIQQAVLLLIEVNRVDDKTIRNDLENMIFGGSSDDIDSARAIIMNSKATKNPDVEEDLILIRKEISLLDPVLNGIISNDIDCPNKSDIE
jgi:hypothetical protein